MTMMLRRCRTSLLLAVAPVLSVIVITTNALDNGLGMVPPMGWNSWNRYGCDIDEALVRTVAEALVPLQEFGYEYLNLDDCWMAPNRTEEGHYQGDPERFPSSMKQLGDHLHSLGFKYGIYTSAGTRTCQGLPGSLGLEEMDAQTFADWGVDYLKYDNCANQGIPSIDRYPVMQRALNETGRPIFFSLCQWGAEDSWQWAPALGNSWRTTGDISPTWNSIRQNFWASQQHFHRSRPGSWLDPDMLEVGNGDLTDHENRAHFSLWCLAKAPLLLGNDLTAMTPETRSIITNRRLIAINQDRQALQASCFAGCSVESDWSILATDLGNGDTVALVINWSDNPISNMTMGAYQVGVIPGLYEVLIVEDLWLDDIVGIYDFERSKNMRLPVLTPHSCVVYEFSTTSKDTMKAQPEFVENAEVF